MDTLKQKLDRLKRIFRGQESYGDGTAAQQDTRYRLIEMYDDVAPHPMMMRRHLRMRQQRLVLQRMVVMVVDLFLVMLVVHYAV